MPSRIYDRARNKVARCGIRILNRHHRPHGFGTGSQVKRKRTSSEDHGGGEQSKTPTIETGGLPFYSARYDVIQMSLDTYERWDTYPDVRARYIGHIFL